MKSMGERAGLAFIGWASASVLVALAALVACETREVDNPRVKHEAGVDPVVADIPMPEEEVVPGGDDDPKLMWVESGACAAVMEDQLIRMLDEPSYVTGNKTNVRGHHTMPAECYHLPEDQLLFIGENWMTSYLYVLEQKPAMDKRFGRDLNRKSWVW